MSEITQGRHEHYVPGYVGPKRLMVALGLVLFLAGVSQVWTPLKLGLFGKRARAEAVRVIKEKPGSPAMALVNDAQVKANEEPRDRGYIFWNEFRFAPTDGQLVEVRVLVGSRVKPLYTLTDSDGLPTAASIWFDPAEPTKQVVFPLLLSVWILPAVLIVVGLLCALVGGTLLYWARRPIELPVFEETPRG